MSASGWMDTGLVQRSQKEGGLVRRPSWNPENRAGPQVRGSGHLWAATTSRWGGLRPGTCGPVLRWANCPL